MVLDLQWFNFAMEIRQYTLISFSELTIFNSLVKLGGSNEPHLSIDHVIMSSNNQSSAEHHGSKLRCQWIMSVQGILVTIFSTLGEFIWIRHHCKLRNNLPTLFSLTQFVFLGQISLGHDIAISICCLFNLAYFKNIFIENLTWSFLFLYYSQMVMALV